MRCEISLEPKDAPNDQDCANPVSCTNSHSCKNNQPNSCFLRISIQQTFMSHDGHMTLYHCDQNDHHEVRIILSCTLCVLHAIWLRNGTKSKQFHSSILISVEHCRPELQATA